MSGSESKTSATSDPAVAGAAEPSTRATVMAIGMMFFINGAVIFSWVPRIADVRDQLRINNGQLGTAILGMGLGGFVASLVLPKLMARFNTRELLMAGGTAQAVSLPLIAFMPGAIALGVLLFMIGMIDLVTDMSMNTQGVMVQERYGRSIMQRLHGGWSLGSFVGTLLAWLAVSAGLSVRTHLILVGVLLFFVVQFIRRFLIPEDVRNVGEVSAKGRRVIPPLAVAIAIMAVGVAILESLPNNWASVSMRDVFGASKRLTGVASMVFSGSMLVGRMSGDYVLERVGEKRLLTGALCLGVFGGVLTISTHTMAVGLLGFALWGLGISVVFPQLYSVAAKLPGLSAGVGLAAMAIGQRIGFLGEPVSTGRLSDHIKLFPAIGVVLTFAVAMLLLSAVLQSRNQPAAAE